MSQSKKPGTQSDYMNDFNEGQDDELETKKAEPTEDFASMLGESFRMQSKRLKVGDKIRGKILNLGSEEIFVTTGTLQDGVLQRRELIDAEGNLKNKVGDLIDVYVTQVRKDEIRLSTLATDRNLAEDIQSAYQNDQPIPGRVVEECKGGVRVNIKGKIAFCPISQLDSRHIETAAEYVGKSFDFKITQITEGGRNIVVSRRKLLDAEREVGQAHFLSETKDGDIVTGKVTRMEPFGAFIELAPGVDGLVHISEIAWSRIGSPSEVLQIGQIVNAKLLKRELLNGKAKLSLSIKQVTPKEDKAAAGEVPADDPWGKLAVGQVFSGKIARKEPYGLFVQLEPGITGLLHKSRTESTQGFQFEKFRVNDTITVQIVEIRIKERQISLGLPQDSAEHEWRGSYKADESASLGTLADRMAAALAKKK
jgi:small subunit ribosomal protein S1